MQLLEPLEACSIKSGDCCSGHFAKRLIARANYVQAGAAVQEEMGRALASVVNARKHPYEINGTQLQQSAVEDAEPTSKAAYVDLRHLLEVINSF